MRARTISSPRSLTALYISNSCRLRSSPAVPHQVEFDSQQRARSACASKNQEWSRMRNGRSGGIRTPGPLVPNQMRYQAALHSDALVLLPTLPIGKLIKHTKCRRCGFSCQSGCNPAGNSRRAADLIPCLATLPPFNSST